MRKQLFPLSYSILETHVAFHDLKLCSSVVVLKLFLFSPFSPCTYPIPRPFIPSNSFSTSENAECKLHLLLNKRPFSTNRAKFPLGRFLGIGRTVISRRRLASEKKPDNLLESYSSIHEILKKYGNLCPEITRRLWRASTLRPGDFLEMFARLEPCKNSSSVVKFLWILFRWAPRQNTNFQHLPRSCEIMISMLIESQMLVEAESLVLWSSDPSGIFSNPSKIFSAIIQGYAENFLLQNAVSLYNRAKNQGFELSCSCYQALLNQLVEIENSDLALRVYMDMNESESGVCAEGQFLSFIVENLGKNNKTLEAVNILRQARTAGIKASPTALDAVVIGYCSKNDYEDILNLMKEWTHIPSTFVGNKVVSSICKVFGSENAWLFIQELKALGFKLDDITFGILIVQSCRERKLRDAFVYLSESSSCGIKLSAHIYNALISGVFKEGMCKAANDIFHEMVDKEILMDLSTYKILLAGYCKYRKFDEIKKLLDERVNSCFISLAPGEDPLSKAFKVLGLDCLGIKVKRDNDAIVSKAEYFDCLGNGLYIETNNYDYESILEKILVGAMNPDLDSILFNECMQGNLDRIIRIKNEVAQWGLELSPQTCSKFLKLMCTSPSHVKETIIFLDENPEIWDQLDCNILNLVVLSLSNKGLMASARSVLDRLLKRGLLVDNATHNAVILGFYKEKNLQGIQECLELLERITYLPSSKDIKILVSCLCKLGMLEEMLMFYDSMTEKYHDLFPTFFATILKELSSTRLSSTGNLFLEEIFKRTQIVDLEFLIDLTKITSRQSYQFLLHFLMSSGRTEEALFLKEHILSSRRSHANFVYSILLTQFCMMGKLREATFHLKEMLGNGAFPDGEILNAFVQEFCRQNYLKNALEILGIMLRTHVELSISGYRSLVRQLCFHRPLSGALNLQKLIQVVSVSKSLIFQNILIFSLFQTKNIFLVDVVLNNMRKTNLLGDTTTYNFLVYGYHKCGILPKSVEVFYDMIYRRMKPNNRSLRTIICYFCLNGELTKALELSNMMVSHGWKHDSCIQNSLAMSLIYCGQLSEAKYLLDRLEEQGLISEHAHYDLLIKGFCVQGEVKKAVHLLNLMLKHGSLPSRTSYIAVIHGFCIHKAFDEALDCHQEMLHKGFEPSEASTDTLIRGLTECDRIDDARKTLGSMLHFGVVPACSMYNYVIKCYYAENNMEKASELLLEMQKAGYFPTFDTHWPLIRNLSSTTRKEDYSMGFLTSLLSADGLP